MYFGDFQRDILITLSDSATLVMEGANSSGMSLPIYLSTHPVPSDSYHQSHH